MGRPKSPIPFDERNRINQRNYRLRHPEKRKETKERWRKANMDKHALHSKAWRERNPEKAKQVDAAWSKRNPDKVYNKRLRRKALLLKTQHEDYLRNDIYEKYEGICQICFEVIDMSYKCPDSRSFSIDHILPLSLGGNDTIANIQAAHYGCNSKKGNRI